MTEPTPSRMDDVVAGILAEIYDKTGISDAIDEHIRSGNPAMRVTATEVGMRIESIEARDFYKRPGRP